MPHLVRWNDELGDFGLVVLGFHVQNVPEDEIKRKAEALGIRFPVTKGGRVEGAKVEGIPHCFVFDHAGECVFDGHPNKVEAKLRAAVGTALVESASLSEIQKPLQPV